MPKSPSRTFKKKKYNARFPPARIKKIMQTDEDVGKVAAAVPVIISRALELFIESLISETAKTTLARNAKTLSTSHIKQTIESDKQFDFLRDLVENIPDHQTEEDSNTDNTVYDTESSCKKARGSLVFTLKKKGWVVAKRDNNRVRGDEKQINRGCRGCTKIVDTPECSQLRDATPKKMKDEFNKRRLKGESSKASDKSENTSFLHLKQKVDDEEDDDDDQDEDTETDEENCGDHSSPAHSSDRLNHAQELSNKSTPLAFMNNAPNINSGFPPHLTNPALSSLQKQQQLLQSHEQFQHQFSSSTPPFPYPPPISIGDYSLPPQYSSSLSLHQQLAPSQQPQHYEDQQLQPMNLSFSSRAMTTIAGENDDYDT